MQNLIDWVCLSEQIKENNNTIRNLTGEYILHTDYIFSFSISPDCRAPAKHINESKTVNPGGLQYKIGLLSQEFMLGNVDLSGEKVEIDIHDLSLNRDMQSNFRREKREGLLGRKISHYKIINIAD